MARSTVPIKVTTKDRAALRKLLKGGIQQVRVVLRARALLQLGDGVSAPQVAKIVPLTPQALRRIAHRYLDGGLDGALHETERPGAANLLEESQRQRIIAMVCSNPPAGRARWTVRLVAEEAVKRKLASRVGRETIRPLLLVHGLKPWREINVVVPELNAEYVAKMEDVVKTYEQPLDSEQPVVCLDEKPVTLHADVRPAKPSPREEFTILEHPVPESDTSASAHALAIPIP